MKNQLSKQRMQQIFEDVLISTICEEAVKSVQPWIDSLPVAHGRRMTRAERMMYKNDGDRNGW